MNDLHRMSGVWALNALDERDNALFERHLRDCPSCQSEAVELQETVARLGVLVETKPPARLKERVLSAAAATRQLPPKTATRNTRTWFKRAGVLTAAAGLVAAVTFGVQTVQEQRELQRTYDQVAAVVAAPDAKTVKNGTTTVVYSPSHKQVVLVAGKLPDLPENQDYQLWMFGSNGPQNGGVLRSSDKPAIMEAPTDTVKLAVTVEPRGGSDKPTTPPLMSMPLT